jgi:hypothetical protein
MPLPGFEQVPLRWRGKAYYVNADSVSTESSSGEGRETSTLLRPLERVTFNNWTTYVLFTAAIQDNSKEIVGK